MTLSGAQLDVNEALKEPSLTMRHFLQRQLQHSSAVQAAIQAGRCRRALSDVIIRAPINDCEKVLCIGRETL